MNVEVGTEMSWGINVNLYVAASDFFFVCSLCLTSELACSILIPSSPNNSIVCRVSKALEIV